MSLIRGLSLEQAADVVAAKAAEALARSDAPLALWTEAGRHSVMVGVAMRDKAAFTVLFDKAEYNGLELLKEMAGMRFDGRIPVELPTKARVVGRGSR